MRVGSVRFGIFYPSHNYSLVALQQGRVQLDADMNESQSLTKHSPRFSLGIGAIQDGFEPPKRKTFVDFLLDPFRRVKN